MHPFLQRCVHTVEAHPSVLLIVGMLAVWTLFNRTGSVPSSEADWAAAMHRVYGAGGQPQACAPVATPPSK